MRSSDELLGLPVMDLSTGEQTGAVRKLIFNRDQDKLLGIVIDEGGWFKEAKIIPFEAIGSIGEHAITIADTAAVTRVEEQVRLRRVIEENASLQGLRVITESGKEIGSIDAVLFDPDSGRVGGFRLSDGLLRDLVAGKRMLVRPESMVMGKDTLIVPESAVAAALPEGESKG